MQISLFYSLKSLNKGDEQGAMTFGEAGKEGARVSNLEDVAAILDVFQKHGHTEVSVTSPH